MYRILRWLTVEQWRAIDADYRTESLPDGRVALVLVTIALSLVLPNYFGKPTSLAQFHALQTWMAEHLPYPSLHGRLYWAGFKALNYFLLPALCIKLVLRDRIVDYGLALRREGRIWMLYGAMLLVVLPLVYAVSFSPAFLRTYPKYEDAAASWTQFVAWETAYGFQFFMLEFFFRGFALFALARYIGSAAIFVMIVPYAMIHFTKPLPETLGSIVSGIALGTIALRTRSIYGGVVVHCAVAWSMDVFALIRKGEFAELLARDR